MKLNEQSKGLGDTIEKITTVTGIKKIAKVISKSENGCTPCEERRKALNQKFPYNNEKK